MTQDMGINPLMNFARKTECSVKLPSQGLWYDDDNITFNAIGEVDIRPMLPNDEMLIVNPETLISGDSIIELIKSCCPSIKRPEELYYPDVNVLLLGIKKATYGDEITQESICPKCWEKKVDLESQELLKIVKEKGLKELTEEEVKTYTDIAKNNIKSKITEMEKNSEILIQPQVIKYSISNIIDKMKFLPKESIYTMENGLEIYITPYRCIDKIKFSTRNIQNNKITKFYNDEMNSTQYEKTSPEYMDLVKKLVNMYEKAAIQTAEIVSCCIKKVKLPNGTYIDNQDYIKEFIMNLPSNHIQKIMDKIDDLNNCGITQELDCNCECCGHTWKEKFYGFNQSDFFGISS